MLLQVGWWKPPEPFGGAARGAGVEGTLRLPGEHRGEAGGPAHGLAASIDLRCLQRAQRKGLPVGSGHWKRGISPQLGDAGAAGREYRGCAQPRVQLRVLVPLSVRGRRGRGERRAGTAAAGAADKPHPARPAPPAPSPAIAVPASLHPAAVTTSRCPGLARGRVVGPGRG